MQILHPQISIEKRLSATLLHHFAGWLHAGQTARLSSDKFLLDLINALDGRNVTYYLVKLA
jgi:hypothetical protein